MDKSIKPKIFFIVHSKSLGNYFIFIFSQEKYEYMKKGKKTYAVSVIWLKSYFQCTSKLLKNYVNTIGNTDAEIQWGQ
jgi:hypothetical protein